MGGEVGGEKEEKRSRVEGSEMEEEGVGVSQKIEGRGKESKGSGVRERGGGGKARGSEASERDRIHRLHQVLLPLAAFRLAPAGDDDSDISDDTDL